MLDPCNRAVQLASRRQSATTKPNGAWIGATDVNNSVSVLIMRVESTSSFSFVRLVLVAPVCCRVPCGGKAKSSGFLLLHFFIRCSR